MDVLVEVRVQSYFTAAEMLSERGYDLDFMGVGKKAENGDYVILVLSPRARAGFPRTSHPLENDASSS